MIKKIESNDAYHSDKTISASGLKTIFNKSVYHHINRKKFNKKPSTTFGSAVHSYCLEGESQFYKEFAVWDKPKGGSKAVKQEIAEKLMDIGSRDIITSSEFENIKKIYENILADDRIKPYIFGEVEASHYSEIDGVPIKCRPDCMNLAEGWISDIKTCRDNSPKKFKWDILGWGYHLQAVCYCKIMGIPVENFRFIAIENVYPFSAELYSLSPEMIEQGEVAFEKALNDWKFYLDTGILTKHNTKNTSEDGGLII
jgi:hypothetical protein